MKSKHALSMEISACESTHVCWLKIRCRGLMTFSVAAEKFEVNFCFQLARKHTVLRFSLCHQCGINFVYFLIVYRLCTKTLSFSPDVHFNETRFAKWDDFFPQVFVLVRLISYVTKRSHVCSACPVTPQRSQRVENNTNQICRSLNPG